MYYYNTYKSVSDLLNNMISLESMEEQLSGMNAPIPKHMAPVKCSNTETHYGLAIDVPGYSKEALHIQVKDHTLHVRSKETSKAQEDKKHPLKEINYTIQLPKNVDSSKISAEASHGLLQVTLPKHAKSIASDIPIS